MTHLHRTEHAAAAGRPPTVETVGSVLAVTFRRGEGCCDEDPVREVTAYYSSAGDLLAERDPRAPLFPERAPG